MLASENYAERLGELVFTDVQNGDPVLVELRHGCGSFPRLQELHALDDYPRVRPGLSPGLLVTHDHDDVRDGLDEA